MSKAKIESRTIQELKNALIALEYEVGMLWSLANVLAIDNQGKGVIHNALLESFLIHARILIEFLYRDEPPNGKDTVLASQYFTNDKPWKNTRPQKTELLDKTAKDAHKYLAHLTYTRLQQGKRQWLYIKIANDIKAALQVFCKKLSDDFNEEAKRLTPLL